VKDRTRVRKTGPAEWTITRPRLGLGDPEVFTAPTGAAAHKLLRWLEKPRGAHGGAERSHQYVDGLSSTPSWGPYWRRGQRWTRW